jgi:hypothetical protein
MGFFAKLGSKIGSEVSDYGQKAKHVVNKGVKVVAEDMGAIAQEADQIGSIAGTVGNIATVGAGIAAATGIGAPIAAGLGGIAGIAKGVQGVAGVVGKGAHAADTGIQTARIAKIAVDRAARGDVKGAFEAGKVAKGGADSFRKQIQR